MNDIELKLKEDRIYIGKTIGTSMMPLLRQGRDMVVITPPEFPLKKLDVPLYRRGDHYTMHRIVKVRKNGYVICGDNRTNLEFDITDKDIIGVMTAFYRDGQYIECSDKRYLRYAKRMCRRLPFKLVISTVKKVIKKILQ